MKNGPAIIDIFAGAGGLSLGAARAGFDISCAVEWDKFALETHCKNFPNSNHIGCDASTLVGRDLLKAANLKSGELAGLIGGPPCQGFSSMGKREVLDERNDLFSHFFRLVAETLPAFFVAENVPGILDSRYTSIRARAINLLPKRYTLLSPIKVCANDYGAPTVRTRVFFIGFDPNKLSHPLEASDFLPSDNTEITNVQKALIGLPLRIDPRWQSETQGWRVLEGLPNGQFGENVTSKIPNGIGCPQSIARYFTDREVSGCLGTKHSEEVKNRFKRLAHGEADPISKSIRLDPNGFCPTLRAGTGKERGSYQAVRPIHYSRARVITPREAARLQGFPDWFSFHSTKWHSFRQIGNSVSPIVSEAIFSKIIDKII